MRQLLLFLCVLCLTSACSLFDGAAPLIIATPMPTHQPRISLTADQIAVRVRGVIVVRAEAFNLGMPQYTFTVTPGGAVTVPYSGGTPSFTPPMADAPFEIIYADQGEIHLRALNAGRVSVSATASGEVVNADGAYMWGGADSNILELSVTP